MDKDFAQIGFLITIITVIILLLVLLLVNLLLTSRNRRLRYEAQMQAIQSKQREELADIRTEVAEATLGDVSRDLHDEVGQLLTFCVLQLENLSVSPEEKKHLMLTEIKTSVRDSLDAIRSISRGLSPDYVNNQGLVKSLEQLLERAQIRTGIKTALMVAPNFILNNETHPIIVFRIIRECVTNALRHGKASRITIGLTSNPHRAEISFVDNGIGMQSLSGTTLSLGFKNMQHYASLINGTLTLESTTDKGTEILLTIPNQIY